MGGIDDLQAALAGESPTTRTDRTIEDHRYGLEQLRGGLRTPCALERMCTSPLGFEWPVRRAVAGTFMVALIHTWDLATATGQDARLYRADLRLLRRRAEDAAVGPDQLATHRVPTPAELRR